MNKEAVEALNPDSCGALLLASDDIFKQVVSSSNDVGHLTNSKFGWLIKDIFVSPFHIKLMGIYTIIVYLMK